jgi:medium-chain acyl-[acyl-carrier-protein] hydrolase
MSRWIRCYGRRASPTVRLLCFPHAGAGATAYRLWASGVPSSVEVLAAQLPGREDRLDEALPGDVRELANQLVQELSGTLDQPYALFGHSMGALIAFEFASLITIRNEKRPIRLFASGYGAPHAHRSTSRLHELPLNELIRELERQGGTPEAVLRDPDLMAIYAPVLRSDLAMCARYEFSGASRLDIPITVFGGDRDIAVSSTLAAWSELTSSTFDLRIFPGDHFFPKTARQLLLDAITHELGLAHE